MKTRSRRVGNSERDGDESAGGADSANTLYGLVPVLEALRAGHKRLEQITIAEGAKHERLHELLDLARKARILVHRVPRAAVDRALPGVTHQGVVARIAAADYRDADELLEDLSVRVGTANPPLVLGLDAVEDPRNLGAILRTAECAGVNGVFIPERRAAGLTATVAKTAAGALEYVAVARVTNLVQLIEKLKQRNIWVIGAAADAAADYTEWDWTVPSAIFLGGEGSGLHRLVRERCDTLVRIPLRGRIESLNVSVAAGVILYEALRQRRLQRSNE
ncbi:MAG TPA: 23S rRNA (guanosine(2251)-2'-O)-methyltransferase RlmB [Pyrinomonadaceae bacterium]|nr:23S rRNA (guanosine(2251)-2'-O)-methyltransferase RlmB [Pyrinomonadaceae bacterium]